MSTLAKTVVATGATSGLGFEAIKQLLLQHSQPYRFILGARDVPRAQAAYDALSYDAQKHSLTVLPLELADLKTVRTFAKEALDRLQQDKIDYLMLNAAVAKNAKHGAPNGSRWCESYVVNHLSQHYLIHLLREKLISSKSRVVVVSSGSVTMVSDPTALDTDLLAGSDAPVFSKIYPQTKFAQLLSAHWWRRELSPHGVVVVACSPGFIPGTGLGRHMDASELPAAKDMPADGKSVAEGARSMLAAFEREDFPADPEQIFLTSWGEWWPKSTYEKSLDRALQEKWSPGRGDIEREEGLVA